MFQIGIKWGHNLTFRHPLHTETNPSLLFSASSTLALNPLTSGARSHVLGPSRVGHRLAEPPRRPPRPTSRGDHGCLLVQCLCTLVAPLLVLYSSHLATKQQRGRCWCCCYRLVRLLPEGRQARARIACFSAGLRLLFEHGWPPREGAGLRGLPRGVQGGGKGQDAS